MRKIHSKSYARALYELTGGKRGPALENVINNFISRLARDRQLKQAHVIIEEFIHYAKAQEGIVEIAIESARELAAGTLNHVKKVFGDKVEAVEKVNPELLGGVVVRAKDTILDGSLRTQLSLLKIKLSS